VLPASLFQFVGEGRDDESGDSYRVTSDSRHDIPFHIDWQTRKLTIQNVHLNFPDGTAAWAVCAAAVLVGTVIQRLAGQGFGMLAAPFVTLVAPGYMPSVLLVVGLVVGLGASAVDRDAIRRADLPAGFAGRTVGAVIAAAVATRLTHPDALAVCVALVIYLGIALSVVGVRVAIRPPALFTAGVAAGIMGTLTAVGAPPMALLYQHEERRRSAAMQSVFFFWGMVVSLPALAVAGLLLPRHVALALTLVPFALAGIALSGPLAARLGGRSIRPWALGLAGAAATLLLASSL
jgi:uncharacterized membrane protein YfcA